VDEKKPTPFADLVTGAVWLAVAIGIVAGAWRMDRLEHLTTTIYTMPGLVPGLLGAALGLMAVILMVRALRAGALGAGALGARALAGARRPRIRLTDHWRLIAVLVLSLAFAIALVGRGPPFWLGAAIYMALMVFVFQHGDRRRAGTRVRGTAFAVAFGLVSGLVIHFAFQDIFLVRLP
jgi:Tripartite tricarboxylate transporter TctB family